jgi:hypothetical protein
VAVAVERVTVPWGVVVLALVTLVLIALSWAFYLAKA